MTQIYNRETVFNKRGKPPVVRIDASKRNARISFSVEAVRLLNFKKDDCLTFITHSDDKEFIFFYIDNKKGIPLRPEPIKTGLRMGVYCRQLARKLAVHFGINGCRSFIVSNEIIKADKKYFFIDKHKTYAGRYKPNGKIN